MGEERDSDWRLQLLEYDVYGVFRDNFEGGAVTVDVVCTNEVDTRVPKKAVNFLCEMGKSVQAERQCCGFPYWVCFRFLTGAVAAIRSLWLSRR